MPLSDEEARLLAQLEASLAAEDPEFASTLRGSKVFAKNRRIAAICVLGFLIGIGLLLGGVVAKATWLGAIGFVAMVAASYFFVRAWRQGISGGDEVLASPVAPGKNSNSFVDRMEERWQRRQDEGF